MTQFKILPTFKVMDSIYEKTECSFLLKIAKPNKCLHSKARAFVEIRSRHANKI